MNKPTDLIATRSRKLSRRGIEARERILRATVACIVRLGFAAMTVENVMVESSLSRGSVLHQFPTRLALAVATAEHTIRFVLREAHDRARAEADPFRRLADYAQVIWDTHSLPEGLALSEILQAAGWDTELAAGLMPVTSEMEEQARDEVIDLANVAGLVNPEIFVTRCWLLVSSVRGLLLEHRFNQNRPMIQAAIAEMKASHRRFCDTLDRI